MAKGSPLRRLTENFNYGVDVIRDLYTISRRKMGNMMEGYRSRKASQSRRRSSPQTSIPPTPETRHGPGEARSQIEYGIPYSGGQGVNVTQPNTTSPYKSLYETAFLSGRGSVTYLLPIFPALLSHATPIKTGKQRLPFHLPLHKSTLRTSMNLRAAPLAKYPPQLAPIEEIQSMVTNAHPLWTKLGVTAAQKFPHNHRNLDCVE